MPYDTRKLLPHTRACRSGRHNYDHSTFDSCPLCEYETREAWRVKNRKKIRRYQRAWHKAHPGKAAEYSRRWREFWGGLAWQDAPMGQVMPPPGSRQY